MSNTAVKNLGGQDHTTMVKWEDFCFSTEDKRGIDAEDQF